MSSESKNHVFLLCNVVVLFVIGHQDDPLNHLEVSSLSSLSGLSILYFFLAVYFSYFVLRVCFVLCVSVSSTAEKKTP